MVEADAWCRMKVEKAIIDAAKSVAKTKVFFRHGRARFLDQHATGNKKRSEGGRFKLRRQRFDKILTTPGRLATVPADIGRS